MAQERRLTAADYLNYYSTLGEEPEEQKEKQRLTAADWLKGTEIETPGYSPVLEGAKAGLGALWEKGIEPIVGVAEGALSAISGLGAFVPSMTAGVTGYLLSTLGIAGEEGELPIDVAERYAGKVSELLAWEPRTKSGKIQAEVFNSPFIAFDKGMDAIGEQLFEGDERLTRIMKLGVGAVLAATAVRGMAKGGAHGQPGGTAWYLRQKVRQGAEIPMRVVKPILEKSKIPESWKNIIRKAPDDMMLESSAMEVGAEWLGEHLAEVLERGGEIRQGGKKLKSVEQIEAWVKEATGEEFKVERRQAPRPKLEELSADALRAEKQTLITRMEQNNEFIVNPESALEFYEPSGLNAALSQPEVVVRRIRNDLTEQNARLRTRIAEIDGLLEPAKRGKKSAKDVMDQVKAETEPTPTPKREATVDKTVVPTTSEPVAVIDPRARHEKKTFDFEVRRDQKIIDRVGKQMEEGKFNANELSPRERMALERAGILQEIAPANQMAEALAGEKMGLPEGKVEAGGILPSMEIPFKRGKIRITTLDSPQQVQRSFLELVDLMKSEIEKPDRVVSRAEIMETARKLGMTYEQLLKKRGKAFTAAELKAAEMMEGAAIMEFHEAQARFAANPTDANKAHLALTLNRGAMIVREVMLASSEAGRSLGSLRWKFKPGELKYASAKKILKMIDKNDAAALERLSTIDLSDPAAVRRYLIEYSKPKWQDKSFEFWVNMLLSSPKTHIVNITSNTITMMGKPIESALAGGLDIALKPALKDRHRFIGESWHEIFAMKQGLRRGLAKAAEAWKNEMSSREMTKLEHAHIPLIKGGKGRAIRTPGRALVAADEFFKAIVHEMDIHGRAFREAKLDRIKKRIPNTREAFVGRVAELIADPTEAMLAGAEGEMFYRTFQKELGKWGKKVEYLRANVPGTRYIVPFIRTPLNIAKFGLERTPLNFAAIITRYKLGKLPKGMLTSELAKPMIGTLTAIAIYDMALDGLVTGSVPTDPKKRAAFYREGKTPYSIKIPWLSDKWFSYGRLEPFGTILGLTADFADIMHMMREGDREKLAGKIIFAISSNLTNKTFLRGFNDFTKAFADPERHGKRFLESLAGTIVPSVVAEAARTIDPTIRDAQNMLQTIQSRIPGWSMSLPARMETFGTPAERAPGAPPFLPEALGRFVSPVTAAQPETDPVGQELSRLSVYPASVSRRVGDEKMTQKEYEELTVKSGELIHQMLRNTMAAPYYAKLSDEMKKKTLEAVVAKARNIARAEIRAKYKRKLYQR